MDLQVGVHAVDVFKHVVHDPWNDALQVHVVEDALRQVQEGGGVIVSLVYMYIKHRILHMHRLTYRHNI